MNHPKHDSDADARLGMSKYSSSIMQHVHSQAACPSSWARTPINASLDPGGAPDVLYTLNALFAREEISALHEKISGLHYIPPLTENEDESPAFSHHVVGRGEELDASSGLWPALAPRFEGCVLPHVREAFRCPECVVCSVSARRYSAGLRLQLSAHRDLRWRATLVLELDGKAGAKDRPKDRATDGSGLFVHEPEEPDIDTARSRKWYPPLAAGDALMHGYQIAHGVHVNCSARPDKRTQYPARPGAAAPCSRYELVAWFAESQAACKADGAEGHESRERTLRATPHALALLERSAARGVAEAQYEYARLLLARRSSTGGEAERQDDGEESSDHPQARARTLLQLAAAANHSAAAVRLGELLYGLHVAAEEEEEAAFAQAGGAGRGEEDGDEDGEAGGEEGHFQRARSSDAAGYLQSARRWLELAWRLGHPRAPTALGIVLRDGGYGREEDFPRAAWLLRIASEGGDVEAQSHYGRLLLQDPSLAPTNDGNTEAWTMLRRAAGAGDAVARALLSERRSDDLKEEL